MQDSRPAARMQADHDGPTRLARARGMVSTAIGGCIAIALIVTVGSWVYGLGTRDPADVPIIRASADPAKVRPDDPGGTNAPYQEIASYQLGASSPDQSGEVTLAPPAPEPRREDAAMGRLGNASAGQDSDGRAANAQLAAIDSGMVDDFTDEFDLDGEEDFADPSFPDPFGEEGDIPPIPEAPPSHAIAGATEQAPPLSPVAPRRPADLKERMLSAVAAAERSADDLARKAAESAIQVQLAAEADEDVVRTMWQRISRANSDILHDRALAVQTTSSGGSTFYRLRVGPFGDVSEARAVCQALKARGQDCVVARNG